MQVKLVSLEDGITACGFRKFAAYATRLNPDTRTYYVTTSNWRTIRGAIRGNIGDEKELGAVEIDQIAQGLTGAGIVGFSSMTGYSDITRRVIARLRELAPETFIVWGGIHPIIHPEDAILSQVDAICTGEGEFAFEQLFDVLRDGGDYAKVRNFWFKQGDEVIRNGFLPLMSSADMETLPFPSYGAIGEQIYRLGVGFGAMKRSDYLANDGLGYTAIWSIGCPFHCTYCGNTAFIANDKSYKKIRHPSARYMVEEIKAAKRTFPHLSQVSFLDDSFMAVPYRELETFAELWKQELDLPFAVYGVIPNYVKQDKFEILTWAGMNRIRMGIQSGSQRILDFYRRPSPPKKILAAGAINASFSPKYHIPPAYDIIMDNPVETRQDVVDTLELLYEMPRPYTLLIYSLKVIPNTQLAKAMEEEGFDLEQINSSFLVIPPRAANLILYVLAFCRPPRRVFDWMLKYVESSSAEQKTYPKIGTVLRTMYLTKRALSHLRCMDFSITPGRVGYVCWRLGLVRLWQRAFINHLPRPERKPRPLREITLPVIDATVIDPTPSS